MQTVAQDTKEFHEVVHIWPKMQPDEFAKLVADIKAHGLREPIWIYQGKIIDGRHRYLACQEAGIRPQYKEWSGQGSLVMFVASLNQHRRHLDAGQLAMVSLEIERHLAKEAHEKEEKRKKVTTFAILQKSVPVTPVIPKIHAAKQAATLSGTSPRYVADAKKVVAQAPELKPLVLDGVISLPDAKKLSTEPVDIRKTIVEKVATKEARNVKEAKRQLKEEEREQRREENRQIITQARTIDEALGTAKFSTIVIDPPWDWGDEGDIDQFGRARPVYGTMSFEELLALPVGAYADTNCHLYLWITNRSLPKGFKLLEQWGFRYVTCVTWVKPSFGMGNYFRGQTEHLLFGVKGSQMLKRKDVGTVLTAPRGPNGHSSKPLASYDLIESCSPGPYLELYARSARPDWTSWGAEV